MKLKEYLQENKEAFQNEKMSNKSNLVFEKLLKEKLHQPKKQKVVYLKYFSVAASIAILISTFLWLNNSEEFSEDKKVLLANLEADSAGKRLEGVYTFND